MNSRQKKILEILATEGNLSVSKLSEMLSVSEVTIRTDLTQLAKKGKVLREHGGAQLLEERVRQEYSFQTRKSQNFEKKNKIGTIAAKLVLPEDSILIDSSTTVLSMAQALRTRDDIKDITVIPTGIWGAVELMNCSYINVLMPSGYLRSISGSITGLPTSEFFENLNINKAFLGAWGISLEDGLTDSHLLEVDLKKLIIKKAKEVIILIDGSKFNQSGLASYSKFENISKIITDESAPKKMVQSIRKLGIEVLITK
jgi:DeoR/GlpR family transcriptional regulator of sugar metabolism